MKSEYENVNRLSHYSNFNYIDIAKKICDKKVKSKNKILLNCRINNERLNHFILITIILQIQVLKNLKIYL